MLFCSMLEINDGVLYNIIFVLYNCLYNAQIGAGRKKSNSISRSKISGSFTKFSGGINRVVRH